MSAAEAMQSKTSREQIWDQIAAGRGALAEQRAGETTLFHENSPVAPLLALLWHDDPAVCRAAALALPGGDRVSAYLPAYGHFAGMFLRRLTCDSKTVPDSTTARYRAVAASLCALLDQNSGEIRAMSNMHYSFLSSALYVALFATCRDTLESVRRLRAAAVHAELCRLLWNLSRLSVSHRINGQDVEFLAQAAGRAMAALPPDEIPELWRGLKHHSLPRRLAVAPVLPHLHDRRAVPHLAGALEDQPPAIAQPLISALRRIGDLRAVPALAAAARSSDRPLRSSARAAIAAIERANAGSTARTLLRPAETRGGIPVEHLLRPAPGGEAAPEELLHVEAAHLAEGTKHR